MKKMAKVAALLAAVALAAGLTACQKKDGADGRGAAQKSAKPTPVNEFSRELTEDGSGVKILKYNGSAKSVVIPSEIEGLPVRIIGKYAFEGSRTSMKSVIIPDSVEEIDTAFFKCKALESVTLGNSVQIITSRYSDYGPLGAFEECTALKSITIPDSVKEIGSEAFKDCTALKSVTLGNSVQEIGDSMFNGCTALKSVTLGNSVQEIGGSAFSYCKALESITIPDSVKKIGGGTFYNCKALKSVTLGNSVQEIGNYAFSDCKALESLTIPDSLQKIKFGDGAFSGTELPLATQARLKALGYTGKF